MIYEILDDKGDVVNRIIAEQAFVDEKYPGMYRDVTPAPELAAPVELAIDPLKAINDKLDQVIADISKMQTDVSKIAVK